MSIFACLVFLSSSCCSLFLSPCVCLCVCVCVCVRVCVCVSVREIERGRGRGRWRWRGDSATLCMMCVMGVPGKLVFNTESFPASLSFSLLFPAPFTILCLALWRKIDGDPSHHITQEWSSSTQTFPP